MAGPLSFATFAAIAATVGRWMRLFSDGWAAEFGDGVWSMKNLLESLKRQNEMLDHNVHHLAVENNSRLEIVYETCHHPKAGAVLPQTIKPSLLLTCLKKRQGFFLVYRIKSSCISTTKNGKNKTGRCLRRDAHSNRCLVKILHIFKNTFKYL